MIDSKFVNGDITGQVFLMNAAKRTKEIAQTGPAAFIGIDMHFPDPIPIVIPSPFIFTVTDRVPDALEFVVTVILIGISGGFRLSELLDERTQARPLSIFHHPHPDLTRGPTLDDTTWLLFWNTPGRDIPQVKRLTFILGV